MAGVQTLYLTALALSVLVSAATSGYVWLNRDRRGALPLSVVFGAASLWGASAFAEAVASPGLLDDIAGRMVLVSVVVLVVAFLLFALEYTGRDEYVTRRSVALLSVEPVIFSTLVWTNDLHRLVWAFDAGGELVFKLSFWIHTVYSYGILAVGVVLIVLFAARSKYLYQRQAAALVVATLTPWVANAASLMVIDGYHLTPIAFAFTSLVLSWAVVREDFLDITPVATETVMDTIDTAVFVVDEQDRIVDLNAAAGELFDFDPDAVVGESVYDLLADLPTVWSVYDDLATSTETASRETRIGDQYVRIEVSPLREHDDRLVGRAFMVVDLTEQREREAELRRRNEQLDRFAGVVSHDLRNPLEVADGSLRLARETGDEEHFDRVESAHERMDRLIEDILLLARQDEESVDPEPVDLGDVARDSWRFVRTEEATLTVSDEDWTVSADEDRLGQLLENCFRNAIEHGGESVSITVGATDDGEGFYVEDDGPGFRDADTREVFEAGYTTTDGGTGFGLSIVQEIATLHGWSVSADEAADGGARIEVRTDDY